MSAFFLCQEKAYSSQRRWFSSFGVSMKIILENGGFKMAIFRVEKERNYTVMSNVHLKDKGISLKAKGLLSVILSLPEDWNYTTRGLAAICKEGVDSIGAALRELESAGYLTRHRLRDRSGRISDTEYVVYS